MELEKLKQSLMDREPGLMDATGRYSVLVPLVERGDRFSLLLSLIHI